ncbi:uncharacterized protein [Rutidosis leptorrhynchoides]|uniref:uncharacterized protein n=1 Tax=Rutidosis leptorrhynchoides TaxID=125765 RepID=UPI003A9912C5
MCQCNDTQYKCNDGWGWKCILDLRNKVKSHVKDDNGSFKWISNTGKVVNFTTYQAWSDLRINRNKVSWHHVIWYQGFDPRHSFIIWLAILSRLNTQDRMQIWLPNIPMSCSLCGKIKDSTKHLFFQCEFSAYIWKELKSNLLFKGLPNDLESIVNRLALYPFTRNIWNIINRSVLAACVYHIWHERNSRLFRGKKRTAEAICEDIQSYIRLKLMQLKVKKSPAILKAANVWKLNLESNCFSLK